MEGEVAQTSLCGTLWTQTCSSHARTALWCPTRAPPTRPAWMMTAQSFTKVGAPLWHLLSYGNLQASMRAHCSEWQLVARSQPTSKLQPAFMCAGKRFTSATAFSMHCKRLQTPGKQGDDGWKSVHYAGKPLDTYRCAYLRTLRQKQSNGAASGSSNEVRS